MDCQQRDQISFPPSVEGVCVRHPLYQRVVTSPNRLPQQHEINNAGELKQRRQLILHACIVTMSIQLALEQAAVVRCVSGRLLLQVFDLQQ